MWVRLWPATANTPLYTSFFACRYQTECRWRYARLKHNPILDESRGLGFVETDPIPSNTRLLIFINLAPELGFGPPSVIFSRAS
jgi:hypothetical protein